jgi:hypothetical protein
MRKIRSFFRHVLLATAFAASGVGAPAQAISVTVDAPGCTAGGVLSWNAATKTVYCLGGVAAPLGSITIVTPDCASDTLVAWDPVTSTVLCQPTGVLATPAASLQITFSLPYCFAGTVTWTAATSTLTCPPPGPPASVATFSGSGQATAVNTPFDNSLIAIVRDAGSNPVAGIGVTFHVPDSGAGAALSATSAITNEDGLASVSASANAALGGYTVTATVAGVAAAGEFNLTNTAPVAPPLGTLNVDKSSAPAYDPLTDGVLVLRYMFGVRGEALTTSALAASAQRNDPVAIANYLDTMLISLDVDNNGTVDALTDGMLILRYMFGLRGDALITGAIGAGASPASATAIELRIQSLMP